MKYNFKAKNEKGVIKDGIIEAPSRDEAASELQSRGLVPITITSQGNTPKFIRDIQHSWDKVTLRELSVFFRQLSTLIGANVSVIVSFQAIQQQTDNKFFRVVLYEMIEDLEDGASLSEAMSKHKRVFSDLMINMVKAGELSGNLQKSVSFLSENTERVYQLNAKVRSALFYPAFVLSAALIIGFVVFTFVLPRLTGVFEGLNVPIPWYTKMFMSAGSFMESYWWAVLVIIFSGILGMIYYAKTETGKKELDVFKIHMPVLGKLFRYIYISRFSENLSVLLKGGIPIVKSLDIVSDVVSNNVYRNIIQKAKSEVKTGGAMSAVLARYEEIDPIVARMTRIGEETGKISEVLTSVSAFYDEEIDRYTRNLTTMIEPIMIVFLGLGVGLLVFAILVPIYNIATSI